MGQFSEAIRFHFQALDFYRQEQDDRETAQEWTRIGFLEIALGRYSSGLLNLTKALAVSARFRLGVDNEDGALASAFSSLGRGFEAKGDFAEALEFYERSAGIHPTIQATLDRARMEIRTRKVVAVKGRLDELAKYLEPIS